MSRFMDRNGEVIWKVEGAKTVLGRGEGLSLFELYCEYTRERLGEA